MFKLLFSSILLTVVTFNSCVTCSDLDSNEGARASKEFPVTQFTSLEIDGPCNIFISQGKKESVMVKSSERNIERTFIENQGDKLIIDFDSPLKIRSRIDIFITVVKVDYMELKGAGNVETKGIINFDTLVIENKRTGNLNAALNGNRLSLSIGGAGNTEINGNTTYLFVEKNGVGNFDSKGLKADFVKFKSSGVGNSDIFAEKVLYLNVSGVGNVSYSGNPDIKELEVHGVGNVEKH